MELVLFQDFMTAMPRAEAATRTVDEKDVPFLALALSLEDCDGIWTNDAHFKKQDLIPVWNTNKIIKSLQY